MIPIGPFDAFLLRIVQIALNILIKRKKVGGFSIIPWGVKVEKKYWKGKTTWVVDHILDEHLIYVKK